MHILGQDRTLLTLDFETYYANGYSLSRQDMNTFRYVAHEDFKIHCVGVKVDDQPTEIITEHGAIVDFLNEMRERNVALLCHNTGFDAWILHYHFHYHPQIYLDTLSMSRAAFVNQPASLKELVQRLWPNDASLRKLDDLALTKGLRELPDDIMAKLSTYCIRDVELTYEAFKLLEQYYPDDELKLIDWTLRCMCEPWLELDTQMAQAEIDQQKREKRDAVRRCGYPETVIKSDKQFARLLTQLGIDIPSKRNAKDTAEIPALSQNDWDYQRLVAANPQHEMIWNARRKLKSNIQLSRAEWFKAVAEWNDGKFPIPLNYYGAATGRWSGSEKLNCQNLPRIDQDDPTSGRLRRALRAPQGNVIVVRDLSNIEGRMLAWVANEEVLLKLFREDGDPYLYMAEKVYGVPEGTFNKDDNKKERFLGKQIVLGCGYGMSANKFHVVCNTQSPPLPLSLEEANNAVGTYRMTNAAITSYWRRCNDALTLMATMAPDEQQPFGPLVLARDLAILPNGVTLQYRGLRGEPNEFNGYDFFFLGNRKIYGAMLTENIVQALARVVIAENLLATQDWLDNTYGRDIARVVHSVHDELLIVCPEEHADTVFEKVGNIMSTPPTWAPDLPLKSEGGYAVNYIK